MITDPFFWIGTVVCAVSLVICLLAAVTKRYPGDAAIISVGAVEIFLIVFGIAAAVRQNSGQPVHGEPWEFWGYVVTAFVLPIAAFWWAVLDKTRWSNVVLAAVPVTVFVMLFRMEQIWNGAF